MEAHHIPKTRKVICVVGGLAAAQISVYAVLAKRHHTHRSSVSAMVTPFPTRKSLQDRIKDSKTKQTDRQTDRQTDNTPSSDQRQIESAEKLIP